MYICLQFCTSFVHSYFRYYDGNLVLDDDDDETKKLLENAEKIMEKENRMRMVK